MSRFTDILFSEEFLFEGEYRSKAHDYLTRKSIKLSKQCKAFIPREKLSMMILAKPATMQNVQNSKPLMLLRRHIRKLAVIVKIAIRLNKREGDYLLLFIYFYSFESGLDYNHKQYQKAWYYSWIAKSVNRHYIQLARMQTKH